MGIIKMILYNFCHAFQSIFWEKDNSCVLIDGWFGQKFADNSRYLFQYLSENKKRHNLEHVVWVANNTDVVDEVRAMGYEAYLMNSKESIYFHKKAKYHIVNNAPMGSRSITGELLVEYSYRSIRINLWHGTGAIKNLGFQSNDYQKKTHKNPFLYKVKNLIYKNCSLFRRFFTPLGAWGDCFFLTTSVSECNKFKSFFCLPDKRIIISGYPRNAYECRQTEHERKIIDLVEGYGKSILYLPTFRSFSNKFNINDLSRALSSFLKENSVIFIQKAHAVETTNIENNFENNVLTLSPDFDINVLTPIVDCIISDYSSILADALYFYKPVLLYVPDYHEYMKQDKGFSKDAEYILSAGKKFFDLETIVDFLSHNIWNPENVKPKNYNEVRKLIWGSENKTMEQIWNDIIERTR